MYSSKNDILGILKFFRRTYTVNDISDYLITMCDRAIQREFFMDGFFDVSETDDTDGLLAAAEICFYLEFAGMTREIENAFGVIGTESVDGYTKKYENGMPMFFFAQGGTDAFIQLLPHETWRMAALRYMEAFKMKYWATTYNDGDIRVHGGYGDRT